MSFRNKGHEKETELVWELKGKGENFSIKWSVTVRSPLIYALVNAATYA